MKSILEQPFAHSHSNLQITEEPPIAKIKKPKIKAELRRQRAHLFAGRGLGSGADYEPFIQVERSGFQSRGRSHVVFNEVTGRQHHLLSDLELLVFLWIWSLRPVDCREQFPLSLYEYDPMYLFAKKMPRGSTEIAKSLGLKHPQITKLEPRVMTTDFLVTFADGTSLAIHAKYLKEIMEGPERSHDLRKIESKYWRERKVRYLVMKETPFTTPLATRMMWAIDGMKWVAQSIDIQCILILLQKSSARVPMGERLDDCAQTLGLKKETVVIGFKYAILVGLWNIHNPFQDYDLGLPWAGSKARAKKTSSAKSFRLPTL